MESSDPLSPPRPQVPAREIEIECNSKRAFLNLNQARVLCGGLHRMRGSEFAQLAGEEAQNWLEACSVVDDGRPVGDWLTSHGLTIHNDELVAMLLPPPPPPFAPPAEPISAEPSEATAAAQPSPPEAQTNAPEAQTNAPEQRQQPVAQLPQRPKRQIKREEDVVAEAPPARLPKPASKAAGAGKKPTLEDMRAHLRTVFIGYKAGDPTAGDLPAQLPPPQHPVPPDAALISLSDWSYDRLMAESATTLTSDPFAALLPEPPGAPTARLGHIAGQDPSRRRAHAAEEGRQADAATGMKREPRAAAGVEAMSLG